MGFSFITITIYN